MLYWANKIMTAVCYLAIYTLIVIFVVLVLAYVGIKPADAATTIPNYSGIVIHHTVTGPDFTVDQCNDMHRARGFDQCGYHFIINSVDGSVQHARPLEKEGAHCKGDGLNHSTIGIAMAIDGRTHTPSPEAIDAFKSLRSQLEHVMGHSLYVTPHREHASTLCPSDNVWNAIKE